MTLAIDGMDNNKTISTERVVLDTVLKPVLSLAKSGFVRAAFNLKHNCEEAGQMCPPWGIRFGGTGVSHHPMKNPDRLTCQELE